MEMYEVSDGSSRTYQTPLLRLWPTRYFIGIRKEATNDIYIPLIKKVFVSNKSWNTKDKLYKFQEI